MKKTKKIHGLDTLEREIYRLRLEAKNIEEKLDQNLDHLQENYWSMALNSFSCSKNTKHNGENGFWKNFTESEGFNSAINSIAGNVVEKAAEGLNGWMNKFFSKNKPQ